MLFGKKVKSREIGRVVVKQQIEELSAVLTVLGKDFVVRFRRLREFSAA